MKNLFPIKNGIITQKFGQNKDFYEQRFGVEGHNGVDIVSFHGDSIFCPEDGVIVRAYNLSHGSVTAGFGLWLLGNPDENGICNVNIIWHAMSNIQFNEGAKISMGDVVAFEGDSGAVFVNMQPVADNEKGKPPFPGTHLHWGKMKVQQVKTPSTISLTRFDGTAFEFNGFFYDILNYTNGFRGCVDPLVGDEIIYYDEWAASQIVTKVVQAIPLVQELPKEEQKRWYQSILDFLKGLFSKVAK